MFALKHHTESDMLYSSADKLSPLWRNNALCDFTASRFRVLLIEVHIKRRRNDIHYDLIFTFLLK
jgi:hypothetical protein